MKTKPKLSVIVPVFNQDKYLARCMRSLLNQTLSKNDYEIIVINDGSTDKTELVLKQFSKEIKLLKNKKNKGLPYSINKGIISSQGRFIVRVDSDDYVNSNFLKFLYEFLIQNEKFKVDGVACDYLLVDDNEKVIAKKKFQENPIGCGIMFKKSHLKKIGFYDKKFFLCEEKELIIRYKKKYNLDYLGIPLYRYRRHNNNITNNKNNIKYFEKLILKKFNV